MVKLSLKDRNWLLRCIISYRFSINGKTPEPLYIRLIFDGKGNRLLCFFVVITKRLQDHIIARTKQKFHDVQVSE